MLMIAVIIALGIVYGMSRNNRRTVGGYLVVSAEGRIMEREKCYKIPELRSIGALPKFAVSDRFIQGVLRQGLCSIDVYGKKDELNGFNRARKYAGKYMQN